MCTSPTKPADSAATSKEKESRGTSRGTSSKATLRDMNAKEDDDEGDNDGKAAPVPSKKTEQFKCKGCGKRDGPPCFLGPEGVRHPDWNDTDKPWKHFPNGIAWMSHSQKHYLPTNKSLKDPTWINPNVKPSQGGESKGMGKKRSFSKNRASREDASKKN